MIKFCIEFPKRGWLSEISSPSRIFLQTDEDPELVQFLDDIDNFYNANHESSFLELNENDLKIGMKVAAFICDKWGRATILSTKTPKGSICSKYKRH